MKKLPLLLIGLVSLPSHAATFEGKVADWKDKNEKFGDPEKNFKLVLNTLRANYVDQNVSEADLYRAATEGMLAALNSGQENENWNVLLSPRMLEDFKIEKTGRLTGIGTTLEFDPKTGYAKVLVVFPHSAAAKAGLRKDDQILSVNGERYKGKGLPEMVSAIRGPAGQSVHLKALREDQILNLSIKRDAVLIPEVETGKIDPGSGFMYIGFFREGTAELVEKKLKLLNDPKLKKLVLDLRGNSGGTFDDAVKVGELFLPKGAVIVRTKSRGGKVEEFTANREPWRPEVQLVVLTNGFTASGAEFLTAALREKRHATTVGEGTQGKWSVQSVENLPNEFAVKYSVSTFESPSGKSYEGKGMRPDLEIPGPKGALMGELLNETDLTKRLKEDAPLKAAVEIAPASI
jgi:carboxyl-terminal processing protease